MNKNSFKIKYINLECEIERKNRMEIMLSEKIGNDINTTRFEAIDKEYIIRNKLLHRNMNVGTAACFLSHLNCISEESSSGIGLLVLEDDVIISEKIAGIPELLENTEFDIIYLGINFGCNLSSFKVVSDYCKDGILNLVDLSNIGFAGAFGYYIKANSIEKISKLLKLNLYNLEIKLPLDIFLSELIHNEIIKAAVLAPFFVALDASNEKSSRDPEFKSHNTLDLLINSLYIDMNYESHIEKCCEILSVSKREIMTNGLIETIRPELERITF